MDSHYLVQFMVYGAIGFTLLLSVIVLLLIVHNKRRYIYQAEIKEREYKYQTDLLSTQLELQEHLLNQVSQEIHDNVGQVLSLVKVHLFSVGNQLQDTKSLALLETSSALLDKAIDDLRNISHAQGSAILEQLGLYETICKELQAIASSKNMDCAVDMTGVYYQLLPEQELLIYRIVQEAINNSLKHSGATKMYVALNYEVSMFQITIADNGRGFDLFAKQNYAGIGINHMRHRAKLLKAELDVISKPGNGTSITLKLPYERK